MNRDLNAIAAALGADIEYLADSLPGHECEILRFGDDRLRYELHLQLEYDTAILAMDPIKPIQPCPMLEYSFCCTDITVEPSAYCTVGNEVAIRFFDGEISQSGHRLTMSWIHSGYWYIWANADARPFAENSG